MKLSKLKKVISAVWARLNASWMEAGERHARIEQARLEQLRRYGIQWRS